MRAEENERQRRGFTEELEHALRRWSYGFPEASDFIPDKSSKTFITGSTG